MDSELDRLETHVCSVEKQLQPRCSARRQCREAVLATSSSADLDVDLDGSSRVSTLRSDMATRNCLTGRCDGSLAL